MNAIDWTQIPLFQNLPEDWLGKVQSIFDLRELPAGANLIEEGSEGDELFILVGGKVRVTKAMLIPGMHLPLFESANPRKTLATLDGSSYPIFGEIGLLDQDLRSATVTLIEDSRFLVTDRARFFALTQDEPRIGNHLLTLLGQRLAATIRCSNAELVKLTTALALALSRTRT
ncbi:MAG: cyclic nucleotide-binding domain-containing protein [Desulfovibrionaceae bacterium]